MGKQIMRVLDAVLNGAETSDQVAAMTGLEVATASAYLTVLADDGLIRLVRRDGRRFNVYGRDSHVYGPPGGEAEGRCRVSDDTVTPDGDDEWLEKARGLRHSVDGVVDCGCIEDWAPLDRAVAEGLRQAAAKGREQLVNDLRQCIRKEPKTIAELQAEIGRLQSKLHLLVLGDPRKGVTIRALPITEDEPTIASATSRSSGE